MGQKSKIEWCDATWNPVTGCKPISEGCQNCYAKSLVKRFPQIHGDTDFRKIVLHPERLQQPLHWKKPQRIFVCSMSDLFHDDVPDDFIGKVSRVTTICHRHTFMILTKRPERMFKWVAKWKHSGVYGFLDNVWLGVTAENQEQADKRIPILLEIPAAKRFVSVEPMLARIDLERPVQHSCEKEQCSRKGCCSPWMIQQLDWVVCGGETGAKARPMELQWARSLRDQCKNAGVPFFFKKVSRGIETPEDLMVREFPK